MTSENKQRTPIWKEFIAGGIGGIFEVVSCHPLDTIKVRLQTMTVPAYRGTIDCLQKTVSDEGLLGLYKGMAAPVAIASPCQALTFLGYGLGKIGLEKYNASDHTYKMGVSDFFLAGALSGVFTTIVVTPGERIKCLLQIQRGTGSPKVYSGPTDCVKKLYRSGGIKSLFRGTLLTLARDVPSTGVYFASYEVSKKMLLPAVVDPGKLYVSSIMAAGGIAGCLAWLVGIVPDVLKSRYQTGNYKSVTHLVNEIIRTEGMRGMCRGFVPVMLCAAPANAFCFLGYELGIKLLNYKYESVPVKVPDKSSIDRWR